MRKLTKTLTHVAVVTLVSLSFALAHAGKGWTQIDSKELGISVRVPDAEACEEGEDGDVALLVCDYGDLKVAIMAHPGRVALPTLREAVRAYSEVPEKHWKKIATWKDENGYRAAEAWSAAGGGVRLIGLVGQSAKRDASHGVLIYGKEAAWKKHEKEIEKFVNGIRAI